MEYKNLIRRSALLPLAFGLLLLQGCAHTLLPRQDTAKSSRGIVLGIKSFYDVNSFDYGPELKAALAGDPQLSSILLTTDISDPRCDAVIKGNFCYYRVKTWTSFYYFSIYFLWLPTLSGLPTSNLDGAMTAEIEVYRKGSLVKTLPYEDVFREPRSYVTLYPTGTSLGSEIGRVAACLKPDLLDLFR